MHESIFKFVIYDTNDWEEICEKYLPLIYKEDIYLMPAGRNKAELERTAPLVANLCKEKGVKYTGRLQIDIWNQATGV